jgi:hypothetical protein
LASLPKPPAELPVKVQSVMLLMLVVDTPASDIPSPPARISPVLLVNRHLITKIVEKAASSHRKYAPPQVLATFMSKVQSINEIATDMPGLAVPGMNVIPPPPPEGSKFVLFLNVVFVTVATKFDTVRKTTTAAPVAVNFDTPALLCENSQPSRSNERKHPPSVSSAAVSAPLRAFTTFKFCRTSVSAPAIRKPSPCP